MWDGTNITIAKDSPRNYMYGSTVFLLDEITDKNCAYLIGDLTAYVMTKENAGKPLFFIINSVGGDVYTMMTIIGLMNIAKINNIPIQTMVMGLAASAASVIAVHGDIRKISNVSRHLVHFGTLWNITQKHTEIEKICEQNKDYARRIDNLYLEHCTRLTPAILQALQSDERGYLNAEQCLEYGFCDAIIEDELTAIKEHEAQAQAFEALYDDFENKNYKSLQKKIDALKPNSKKKK